MLAEELQRILEEARCEGRVINEDDPEINGSLCEDTGTPCWHLQEAAQFIAEDMAVLVGIDPFILAEALTEAMSCDQKCGEKYRTAKGDFKGGKGEAFKSCEKYAEECCSGVTDPAAFCAYLGRRANR